MAQRTLTLSSEVKMHSYSFKSAKQSLFEKQTNGMNEERNDSKSR